MSWCARGAGDLAFKNTSVYSCERGCPWRQVGIFCLVTIMIWLSAPGLAAAVSMVPDDNAPTLMPALGTDGVVMERPGSLLPDIDQVLTTIGNHNAIEHTAVAHIGAGSKIFERATLWKLSFSVTLALGLLYLSYPAGCKVARNVLLWCDARAMGVRRIVDVDSVDFNDLTTPAAVRSRGWSPELMVRLLGAPDYAVVDPRNRSEPLVFISRRRVECLETTRAFLSEIETQKRQATASDSRVTEWISLQEDRGAFLGTLRGGI